MADYNVNTKSLLYGLSDFWLHFFKETDTLSYFYKGAEIQIGQAYLDLLSLLLNNSVQDATVFNKEYFKLLSIKESDVEYVQGVTPSASRYYYVLPDNVVQVPYLNNKILFPTDALDRNTDYYLGDDGTNARLEFLVDPTNAYYELVVGSAIASVRVRSKFTGSDGGLITVYFNDNGNPAITITRTDYAIQIDYDGPFNTATHSAAALVQAINTNADVSNFILAEVVNAVINASPSGTGFPTPLTLGDSNPLDNFAKRKITAYYGGSFMCSLVPSWTSAGVRKGDTIRLRTSKGIGNPVELDIDLLQGNKLFVNVNTPIPEDNETSVDFVVLRTPANHTSLNEPFSNSGAVIVSGADGDIDPSTRVFTSATANFKSYNLGDIINIPSGLNQGFYTIISVIDANNVTLAATNFVVNPIPTSTLWELYSVNNLATGGVSAIPTGNVFTTDYVGVLAGSPIGAVFRVKQGTTLFNYTITSVDPTGPFTTVTVSGNVPAIAGTEWIIADTYAAPAKVIMSPPMAWPTLNTIVVNARRLVDDQLVQEGADYRFNTDTGILEPLTVWHTALNNHITYDFALAVLETVTPTQQGILGSIVPGSPNTFVATDANFQPEHVGFAINVSNSGFLSGVTNNGAYYISAVISTTTVQLTPSKKVNPVVDSNNGSLVWTLNMRGSSVVQSDSAIINEISFWASDVLVDRFNLYNTFGYLISKYSRSSEAYRDFIRGVFQLFMLGPTLERFESAINILAGLPVIRDDNETLITYSTGALASFTADGNLFGVDSSFTSIAYAFTFTDINKQIFVNNGLNANHTFTITSVVSAGKVILDPTPTTDVNVNWELRELDTPQSVVTNRHTYTLPRAVPVKSKYLNTGNYGVLKLQAFEVISSIFLVTDYVETPRWWESTTIPAELWEGESVVRRSSTPQLFENIINPADGGRIGDPGFIIGAGSDGFVPPQDVVRTGISDGTLLGDPLYPISNNTYFTTPTGNFTIADIGNLLAILPGIFRITNIVSTTKIQIESFVQQPVSTAGVLWEVRSGAIALRHKAAFVVLDKYLKQNLFTVTFDFSTIGLIDLSILTDLKKLIFGVKPSYTYLVLNPYAIFEEVVKIIEDFDYEEHYYVAGTGGDVIAGNENPLLVIGSSWRIGQWFRNVEKLSTFTAPTPAIFNTLGAPAAGYMNYVNKFAIVRGPSFPDNITEDHSTFTSGGIPIQIAEPVKLLESGPTAGASIVTVAGDVRLVIAASTFNLGYLLAEIVISGSGVGNNGTYTIGMIHDGFTASLYRSTPGVPETGLTWELYITGDLQGQLGITTGGMSFFQTQQTAAFMVDSSLAGYLLRRPLLSGSGNSPNNFEAYRLHALTAVAALGATVWSLYKLMRVEPLSTDPSLVGAINAGNELVVTGVSILFAPSMAYYTRLSVDATTYLKNRYFVQFVAGANTGTSIEIMNFVDTGTVMLDPSLPLTLESSAEFFIYQLQAYDVVPEISTWEVIKEQVVIDKNNIDLTGTPAQDAATINYRAYGVCEPLDPSIETFDASLGDTLYSIGMPDPKPSLGKSRTGRDTDFREDPLQIRVI